MDECMTQFDAIRKFLDIANEYNVGMTPETFKVAVEAATKENMGAAMAPIYAMMAELKNSDCDCKKD